MDSFPTGPFQTNRYWREAGFILGGWIVVTIIAGVITVVNYPTCGYTAGSWTQLVSNQSAQFGLWAVLTPGIFWVTRIRMHPIGGFIGRQVLAAGAVLGVVTLGRAFIHNWMMHEPEARHEVLEYAQASIARQGHFDILVYLGLFTVGLAFTHYHRAQDRERKAAELESELSRAQLQVLQAQVNPHFLFNALNTVSSLVEDDPTKTRRVVAQLSSLLRRSLDSSAQTEIPLGEELSFVRQYLSIMQARYGDRLVYAVDLSASVRRASVPAFVLQPIVENAIKHGVSRIAHRGRVRVAARREGDTVILIVEDNGPGVSRCDDVPGCGVGLAAVRSRLNQMYGDAASLTLQSGTGNPEADAEDQNPDRLRGDGSTDRSDAEGACVTIRVPYRPYASDAPSTRDGMGHGTVASRADGSPAATEPASEYPLSGPSSSGHPLSGTTTSEAPRRHRSPTISRPSVDSEDRSDP